MLGALMSVRVELGGLFLVRILLLGFFPPGALLRCGLRILLLGQLLILRWFVGILLRL